MDFPHYGIYNTCEYLKALSDEIIATQETLYFNLNYNINDSLTYYYKLFYFLLHCMLKQLLIRATCFWNFAFAV